MNWKQIQKKYPKAWKLMDKWASANELNDVFHELLHARYLYDFFDKQKIYGCVVPMWDDWSLKISYKKSWVWNVKEDGLKSRKSAEKALFTRCFEILEGRLK